MSPRSNTRFSSTGGGSDGTGGTADDTDTQTREERRRKETVTDTTSTDTTAADTPDPADTGSADAGGGGSSSQTGLQTTATTAGTGNRMGNLEALFGGSPPTRDPEPTPEPADDRAGGGRTTARDTTTEAAPTAQPARGRNFTPTDPAPADDRAGGGRTTAADTDAGIDPQPEPADDRAGGGRTTPQEPAPAESTTPTSSEQRQAAVADEVVGTINQRLSQQRDTAAENADRVASDQQAAQLNTQLSTRREAAVANAQAAADARADRLATDLEDATPGDTASDTATPRLKRDLEDVTPGPSASGPAGRVPGPRNNTDEGFSDELLGFVDEGYARADRAVARDDAAGLFDAAAGSLDEAVGRATAGPEVNEDVVAELTEGRGFLSAADRGGIRETQRDLLGDLARRDPEAGDAERFVRGAARTIGSTPFSAVLAADTAATVAQNLEGAGSEIGAGELAETGAALTRNTLAGTATEANTNPASFAGSVFGGAAVGVGAGRAIQAAPDVARSASIRARGGEIYDFDELSDPPTRTESSDLPGFTERAQADPDVAREEFIEQAEGNELLEDVPVAFHGRSAEAVRQYGRFGRDFEAPEGGSELRGLFQSADLSNLRVGGAEGSSGGLSLGLPRPQLRSSRVLAERDVEVDVAPVGSRGRINQFLTEEADRQRSFIRTDAGGGPTPEQEAIAPPGSQFVDDGGVFGVRVGGRDVPFTDRTLGGTIVPGRLTRRGEADIETDADDADADMFTRAELADETSSALSEASRRQATQPDAPFAPVTLPGASTTTTDATAPASGDVSGRVDGEGASPLLDPFDTSRSDTTATTPFGRMDTSGGLFGERRATSRTRDRDTATTPTATRDTTTTTPTASGTPSGSSGGSGLFGTGTPTSLFGEPADTPTTTFAPTDTPSGSGPSSPPSTPPSTPPSSPPSTPPSSPPSSPPSGPPSGPPSSPPSGPPTTPPGGPPSGPPLIPGVPSTPPQPPTRRPRRDSDETDRDDDPEFRIAPEGQRFANPVASGTEFLFGGGALDFGLGTSAGTNTRASTDTAAVFGDGSPFGDFLNGGDR